MSRKRDRLFALGAERRAADPPSEFRTFGGQRHLVQYRCIGDYCDGHYESNFVSPYTKTAKNFNAGIAVLLQDWASDDFLCKPFDQKIASAGLDERLTTNKNLR